jgi:hypothetical protein
MTITPFNPGLAPPAVVKHYDDIIAAVGAAAGFGAGTAFGPRVLAICSRPVT